MILMTGIKMYNNAEWPQIISFFELSLVQASRLVLTFASVPLAKKYSFYTSQNPPKPLPVQQTIFYDTTEFGISYNFLLGTFISLSDICGLKNQRSDYGGKSGRSLNPNNSRFRQKFPAISLPVLRKTRSNPAILEMQIVDYQW